MIHDSSTLERISIIYKPNPTHFKSFRVSPKKKKKKKVLSHAILLVDLDCEALGRRSDVGISDSPEFGLILGPPVLDLDIPQLGTVRSDDGADMLVLARGVLVSPAGGAGAGGVKARGVLGGDARDVEVVLGGCRALAAGDSKVRDIPGQRWAGTALGESLEGSRQSERGEKGEREELHIVDVDMEIMRIEKKKRVFK